MAKKQKLLNNTLERMGNEFRKLREKKGFDTIKEFARYYRLSPIQYWRIERGKSNVTMKTILQLLAIHRLSVTQFFCPD
jgi:transcriptional regulator with XRE-family HTH domain